MSFCEPRSWTRVLSFLRPLGLRLGALENFQVVAPILVHAVELLHEDPHAEKGHLASNP